MAEMVIHEVPANEVSHQEGNRHFEISGCETLMKSIGVHGQQVPGICCRIENGVLVREREPQEKRNIVCVDGNRRLYCCRVLGIPFRTIILDHKPSSAETRKLRLTTNTLREAMNPFDLAKDVVGYMEETGIKTQQEVAEALCIDKATINRALGTNRIPEELRAIVPLHSAYAISTLPTPELMRQVAEIAVKENLTRDQVAKLVAEKKGKKATKAKPVKAEHGGGAVHLPSSWNWESVSAFASRLLEAAKKGMRGDYPLSMLPKLIS